MISKEIAEYQFLGADHAFSHAYILPELSRILDSIQKQSSHTRLFEVGAGNGSTAQFLSNLGYDVAGIEPSKSGVLQANQAYPSLQIRLGSAYDDLQDEYGQFPVVYSLEVIEHIFYPRKFASTCYDLLAPGGTLILSTPYHGYIKNLVLALSGKMDAHFTALWDHGHIKFWSFKTLRSLLLETGFSDVQFRRVGRAPPLAKSMIAIASKE